MKTQGSLAEQDFPRLVQALHERRWTGVLTLTHAGVGKSVVVQEGRMVFASSSSRDERLGELMLRRGRITLRQLAEAGKAMVPGKRLGTVLVEQGALAPKDLVKSVIEHTQEIIYGAFLWTEGHYRLELGGDTKEAIKLNISTPDLILEGIRRIDSWTRIDRAVGGLTARYERIEDYEARLRGATLPPEKLAILTHLTQPRTVENICESSTLPDFEVCRTLWAYRVVGVVRRMGEPALAGTAEGEGLGLMTNGES
ncbi:MAG TPA: DUF4388 domain-containing protein [Vicinamibacteria bacterium]|nr:DUF4388 domain-containing protein [Vicinamibacteria bacterium]